MKLPLDVVQKLNEFYYLMGKNNAVKIQKELTEKYKTKSGNSISLINRIADSELYAISRMPATFSVIYDLIEKLVEQRYINDVLSFADFGSGTGAGYFAAKELFKDADIELFERDKNMIKVFEQLSNNSKIVNVYDLCSNKLLLKNKNNENLTNKQFDLCLSCYVLSEMNENDRLLAFQNLALKTNKYLLLIDTGTPKVYDEFMRLKAICQNFKLKVIAPCLSETCPLKNDYCQFYSRVERSSELRQAKQAKESFEDEKYFYLLFEKIDSKQQYECYSENQFRVIRRPVIKKNCVELVLCGKDGVVRKIFTKKNKEQYRQAKKCKINDMLS